MESGLHYKDMENFFFQNRHIGHSAIIPRLKYMLQTMACSNSHPEFHTNLFSFYQTLYKYLNTVTFKM